jgi:hypothetical protein
MITHIVGFEHGIIGVHPQQNVHFWNDFHGRAEPGMNDKIRQDSVSVTQCCII